MGWSCRLLATAGSISYTDIKETVEWEGFFKLLTSKGLEFFWVKTSILTCSLYTHNAIFFKYRWNFKYQSGLPVRGYNSHSIFSRSCPFEVISQFLKSKLVHRIVHIKIICELNIYDWQRKRKENKRTKRRPTKSLFWIRQAEYIKTWRVSNKYWYINGVAWNFISLAASLSL